jgi:hypothetical protein
MSPAATSNGHAYNELYDFYSQAHGGIGYQRSAFSAGGFSADPGQAWLTSVTCLGVTITGASARYTFLSGVASWAFITGGPFGFSSGSTTCTIVHQ